MKISGVISSYFFVYVFLFSRCFRSGSSFITTLRLLLQPGFLLSLAFRFPVFLLPHAPPSGSFFIPTLRLLLLPGSPFWPCLSFQPLIQLFSALLPQPSVFFRRIHPQKSPLLWLVLDSKLFNPVLHLQPSSPQLSRNPRLIFPFPPSPSAHLLCQLSG